MNLKRFWYQYTAKGENLLYGHLHILARECGLPVTPFLSGQLQHGWVGTDGWGLYEGRKIRSKKFVWSKRVANEIVNGGGKNVFDIGAPWLYMLRQQRFQDRNAKRIPKVIAYPLHAQPWARTRNTHSEYSRYLFDRYGKVTVSLHWTEYSDPTILDLYKKFNHSIVTNGIGTPWLKNFDMDYLLKQFHILNTHTLFVSNTFQTAALYALSLGLQVEFGGPVGWTEEKHIHMAYGTLGRDYWMNRASDSGEQESLWREELGANSVKSPQNLNELLNFYNKLEMLKFFSLRTQDVALNGDYGSKLKFVLKK